MYIWESFTRKCVIWESVCRRGIFRKMYIWESVCWDIYIWEITSWKCILQKLSSRKRNLGKYPTCIYKKLIMIINSYRNDNVYLASLNILASLNTLNTWRIPLNPESSSSSFSSDIPSSTQYGIIASTSTAFNPFLRKSSFLGDPINLEASTAQNVEFKLQNEG